MNTSAPPPYSVHVCIFDEHGNLLHSYKLNWNDPEQRTVFAIQANEAVRNNQIVTTMPERIWCRQQPREEHA